MLCAWHVTAEDTLALQHSGECLKSAMISKRIAMPSQKLITMSSSFIPYSPDILGRVEIVSWPFHVHRSVEKTFFVAQDSRKVTQHESYATYLSRLALNLKFRHVEWHHPFQVLLFESDRPLQAFLYALFRVHAMDFFPWPIYS